MYINMLNRLYKFLIEELDMPDFMSYDDSINLLPISNIEYRDKIRGAMVGLAIGDSFGTYLEGHIPKEVESVNYFLKTDKNRFSLDITENTEMAIMIGESFIINQGFQPEDIVKRFVRYNRKERTDSMGEFIRNYRDLKREWYRSGVESSGNEPVIRCVPIPLISYGDYELLRLIAGIQTIITNREQTTVAASIFFSTTIAHLLNLSPFILQKEEDKLQFINTCGKSIKGIEMKVYPTKREMEISNLYTRINLDLYDSIKKDADQEILIDRWENKEDALTALPLATYIFLKNCNDYEKILKKCLHPDIQSSVAAMALTMAGAYIGFNNIPKGYVNKLRNLEEMITLADRLFELSLKNKNNNPYRRMRENPKEMVSKDELDHLLWTGIKHNKDEKYDLSVKYFEDLLNKNPELKRNEKIKTYIIEAYGGLGVKLLSEENYEEATKYLKKALVYDLNNHIILNDLSIAYLNLDDLERAEKYARRVVEIAPEYQIGREVLEAIRSFKKKS